MFDEILQLVRDHLANNPQIAAAIPADQQEAVHNEIANHITNNLGGQPFGGSGFGSLLTNLENSVASGGPVTSAIEGGLVNSLTTKFGLPPAITGAIAGALPGLLQKFAQESASPSQHIST